jgi:hypothetical protein
MAINSQGSSILHDNGNSPGAYTAIEEVSSINGPQGTASLIDVSHLGSSRKEYLQGLADDGQIQITANFIAGAQQMDLKRMFNENADPEAFLIQIPTDSTKTAYHKFYFSALVMKWSITDGVDAKVVLDMTLQTSGGVTYVAPS